jgi:hypothetical protein
MTGTRWNNGSFCTSGTLVAHGSFSQIGTHRSPRFTLLPCYARTWRVHYAVLVHLKHAVRSAYNGTLRSHSLIHVVWYARSFMLHSAGMVRLYLSAHSACLLRSFVRCSLLMLDTFHLARFILRSGYAHFHWFTQGLWYTRSVLGSFKQLGTLVQLWTHYRRMVRSSFLVHSLLMIRSSYYGSLIFIGTLVVRSSLLHAGHAHSDGFPLTMWHAPEFSRSLTFLGTLPYAPDSFTPFGTHKRDGSLRCHVYVLVSTARSCSLARFVPTR